MSSNGYWTSANIPNLEGKIAIVTGANSGIGYETARALAHKGAQVIVASRNVERGTATVRHICSEEPRGTVEFMPLDLSDLSSVRRFADEFTSRYDRLDILCNNAGVMMTPYDQTVDGFELQFGTNHLGHFALTGLLLDTITRTPDARVVTVSSTAHHMGRIDFDNLNAEKNYRRVAAYAQSKLANLLFCYELQRRLEAAGVDTISTAAHPGWTATNLQQHVGVARFLNRFLAQGPEEGAWPTLYAATAPDVKAGDFYGPEGIGQMRGHPRKVASTRSSHDREVAARLWAMSEELTGVRYLSVN